MILSDKVFREDEKAIYKLRELYSSFGFNHYRVSKFEEYDLYAKNKNFLVSENLLTFTDTNGKLMALKPDVTLSIIKNAVADPRASYKLYYDERVYRTTTGGDGFREIMQIGLESIGNIDLFSQSEVIMLALKSLESISNEYLLDMSNMRLLEGLLENAGVRADSMADYFALIGTKNVPALTELCRKNGINEQYAERISRLTAMYLPIKDAICEIKSIVEGEKMQSAYDELSQIYSLIDKYGLTERLYLDFSVVNDMNYYDGIIFKGFVNGIPDSILSGGRYDRLMEKFGKKTGAIGFAVYLDKLERFGRASTDYDIDVMIVYDDDVCADKIIDTVKQFSVGGCSVRTANAVDLGVRYAKLVRLTREGADILETND